MDASEVKTKSKEEIRQILGEKKERLCQLGFDLASGKVKNVREIREIKKDIARILTVFKDIKNK